MPEMKLLTDAENLRLLGMDEAANLLGLKKSTLYMFVMRKKITHVKLGKLTRFRPSDLQEYISRNLVEVRPQCL